MSSRFKAEVPQGVWDLAEAPEFTRDAPVLWIGKRVSQLTAMKGAVRLAFVRKAIRYRKKESFDGWFAEIRGFEWNWREGEVFDLAPREGRERKERFFPSLGEAKATVDSVLANFPILDAEARRELLILLAGKKLWNARWGLKVRVERARAEKRWRESDHRLAFSMAVQRVAKTPIRTRNPYKTPEENEVWLIAKAKVAENPGAYGVPDLSRPRKRLRRR